MKTHLSKKPLSSHFGRGRHRTAAFAPAHAGNDGWRSEAFAEDLLGDMVSASSLEASRHRWQGALQCAVPLAVALVAGVVACLQTLA